MGIPGWNTTQEAAEKLGVTQRAVQRRIKRGTIKAKKVGNTHLISDYILNKLLEEKK